MSRERELFLPRWSKELTIGTYVGLEAALTLESLAIVLSLSLSERSTKNYDTNDLLSG